MSAPVAIRKRPFAIEPRSGVMLPDGIFEANLFDLELGCFATNVSGQPATSILLRLHPEPGADWRVVGDPTYRASGGVIDGAAVFAKWPCDFRGAAPGKKRFKIEFNIQYPSGGADGFLDCVIFVTRTAYVPDRGSYVCEVPEGTLEFVPKHWSYSPPLALPKAGDEGGVVQGPPLRFPEAFVATVHPSAGNEGKLPFEDPWWKVVAWIVAFVSGVGALIAAHHGQGTAAVGVGGEGDGFDPRDYDWCVPDPDATRKTGGMTIAGILSTLCTVAIRVGMMDEADPWHRARRSVAPDRPALAETVEVQLTLPDTIRAGSALEVPISWQYTKAYAAGVAQSAVTVETGVSRYHLDSAVVRAPDTVKAFRERLYVEANLVRSGQALVGDQVYAYAEFLSPGPDGRRFRVQMEDRSLNGRYVGSLDLEAIMPELRGRPYEGEWTILVVAQDVNDALPTMSPEEAAMHIGGSPLISPVALHRLTAKDEDKVPPCQPDKIIKTTVTR